MPCGYTSEAIDDSWTGGSQDNPEKRFDCIDIDWLGHNLYEMPSACYMQVFLRESVLLWHFILLCLLLSLLNAAEASVYSSKHRHYT